MQLELRVPPPFVAAAIALLEWLAARLIPFADFPLPGKAGLAIALAIGGLGLGIVALLQFKKARTTHHPRTPHEASALVTSGLYRFTRNPMYLGVLLVLAGWAVWLANVAAFAGLPAFVAYLNKFQIGPEEKALEARFGAAFAEYRRAVRRWL